MGPIEKGIPIPNHDGRGIYPRTSKWGERYAEMDPGDSFTVDRREYMAARLAAALRQIQIVTRLDPKAGKHVHRIWRL